MPPLCRRRELALDGQGLAQRPCGYRETARACRHSCDGETILPATPGWSRHRVQGERHSCPGNSGPRRDWAGPPEGRVEHQGRQLGCRHARAGGVTFVQRFGAALNRNPHLHILMLDDTTHLVFAALEFIDRLAALVPPLRRPQAVGRRAADPDSS